MGIKHLIYLLMIITACYYSKQDDIKDQSVSDLRDNNVSRVYLYFDRSGYIDTVYTELVSRELIDSVYQIAYKTVKEKGLDEPYVESHKLPIGLVAKSDDSTDKMLDKKKIEYLGKQYQIYKTFYDDPNSYDEEMLYFFEPSFGIIIQRSAAWGSYTKLIDTGDEENNKIVSHLSELIMQDSVFFNEIKIKD